MLRFSYWILFLFLSFSPHMAQAGNTSKEIYKQAYITALITFIQHEWMKISPNHHNEMYVLGYLHEKRSKPGDIEKAVEWYKKSSELNNKFAISQLGYMYETGRGVPKNQKVANDYFEQAAAMQEPLAMYALGLVYAFGKSKKRDTAKAAELILTAVESRSEVIFQNVIKNFSQYPLSLRKSLQTLLKEAGHYNSSIDGIYGPGTRKALNQLTLPGVLSDKELTKANNVPYECRTSFLSQFFINIREHLGISSTLPSPEDIKKIYTFIDQGGGYWNLIEEVDKACDEVLELSSHSLYENDLSYPLKKIEFIFKAYIIHEQLTGSKSFEMKAQEEFDKINARPAVSSK